jgi:cobalt-zinc-cadmium efflux system membrane fusion protein
MTNYVKWTSGLLVVVVAVGTCACGGRSTTREAPAKAEAGEASEKSTKADVDQKADAIEIPSETQQRLDIVASSVTEAPLAMTLSVSGTVQPNESRVSHVRPLARGRVQAVHVKVGDRVTQGQALADFDNIEAGELATQHDAARAELARLQAQLTTATRQTERSRKLVEIGAAPQKEYEASLGEQHQIEASIAAQQSTVAGLEARLRRFGLQEGAASGAITSIRSPLSGVVTHVTAAPGDVVDATSELFAIADLSRVYVQAQVFEKDLGQVHVGQRAAIRVDAYPDERFTGSVVAIGDVIDPQTRTAAVRCDVANPNSLLKLDMFATVELPTGSAQPALAVPTDAVQNYEGKSVVFVRASATRFEVRPVELGRTVGAAAEVTRGVRAGDSVVTRGAFQVKSALLAKELGEKDDDKDKKE